MQFTRTLDDITFKNPVCRDGGWITVQLPQGDAANFCRAYSPTQFVANYSDLAVIAQHRWRYLNGRILTTTTQNGHEVSIGIENVLLNRPRHEIINHVNGDALDVRRVNLTEPSIVRTAPVDAEDTTAGETRPVRGQTITAKGDVAYVHLYCGMTITVDRSEIFSLRPYRWYPVKTNAAVVFKANSVLPNGGPTTLTLHRHILNRPELNKHPVTFINGDRTDLRRENLRLEINS